MSESPVQSVDRAIEVLEYLADHGESGVQDVAAHLEVHKSTAFRLLSALEFRRLVEQPGERGKYRLGIGLIRLATSVSAQLDITRIARPILQELADTIGETVNIAVPDGNVTVNIDQVRGGSSIISHNWLGERSALHATSSGKALMAYDDSLLKAGVDGHLELFTANTITTKADLLDEIETVRATGIAYAREELEIGLNATAATIISYDGSAVGAITVSGPAYRLDEDHLSAAGVSVLAAAQRVSTLLGWSGHA
ncbi:IclR family transcriptional regulator [Rhodococcus sp. IEGM 1374]|uniref:IclR family transcriptional regulator n=1 Tax=Rhodococcus sp. IEGM 1374 TaxID=3082221 RepID=UPI002953993E|nr:IclR family transcriptional regulator [Rhodococcus sp. IEGM 1374]MDV7990187.1 IclR family transcriptional regulator [Rhodococcus sp. IEGM 1374]